MRVTPDMTRRALFESPAIAHSFAAKRLIAHPVSTRIADGMACSTPHPEALRHILDGAERIAPVVDHLGQPGNLRAIPQIIRPHGDSDIDRLPLLPCRRK